MSTVVEEHCYRPTIFNFQSSEETLLIEIQINLRYFNTIYKVLFLLPNVVPTLHSFYTMYLYIISEYS